LASVSASREAEAGSVAATAAAGRRPGGVRRLIRLGGSRT